MKALSLKVLPALLYGCEIWGLAELRAVACGHKSPFLSDFLGPVLEALKQRVGLPAAAFNLPVYRLFQLPTFVELALPRVLRLTTRLAPEQWTTIEEVAASHPTGLCAAWVALRDKCRVATPLGATPVAGAHALACTVLQDFFAS